MMYQKGTRGVKPIVYFIQGYCKYIWLEIAFVFLLNGLLESVHNKRLLIHRVQKSAHVKHFGYLGTGH